MKKKPYLGLMVVAAFGCFLSAMQIDSYQADLHHTNTLWWVVTIVCGLVAVGSLVLAIKTPME